MEVGEARAVGGEFYGDAEVVVGGLGDEFGRAEVGQETDADAGRRGFGPARVMTGTPIQRASHVVVVPW